MYDQLVESALAGLGKASDRPVAPRCRKDECKISTGIAGDSDSLHSCSVLWALGLVQKIQRSIDRASVTVSRRRGEHDRVALSSPSRLLARLGRAVSNAACLRAGPLELRNRAKTFDFWDQIT